MTNTAKKIRNRHSSSTQTKAVSEVKLPESLKLSEMSPKELFDEIQRAAEQEVQAQEIHKAALNLLVEKFDSATFSPDGGKTIYQIRKRGDQPYLVEMFKTVANLG